MRKAMLIAGGSRGIGAAVARLAGARGYDVAIGYRGQRERAEAVATEVIAGGGRGVAIQADVRDPHEVERLFSEAQQALGGLDAVVISAGITGRASALADTTADVLQETIDINVVGALLCAREAVRRMARSRGGRGGGIVTLSSGAATLGSPGEFVWYAASKGAVDSMTIGLAKEVASEGIRVNTVRPGLMSTDFGPWAPQGRNERLRPGIPMGRAGEPHEMASAIVWLASDAASYVTGAFIDVGGGR